MLEDFLAQEFAVGSLDSRGSFTISAEQARQKMAQSGLDTRQKGLLKLVQLGVDSLCDSIAIRLDKDEITFIYQDPGRGLLEDRTLSEDLQAALLACVYSGFRHATYETTTLAWRLHKDFIEPVRSRLYREGAVRVVLRRWTPSGFWEKLRHLLADRTEDYTTFLSYLGYCPIPLQLDGARPFTESRSVGTRALDLRLLGPPGLSHSGVRIPFADDAYVVRHSPFAGPPPTEGKAWLTFGLVERRVDKRHFRPDLPAWSESEGPVGAPLGLLYSPLHVPPGGFIDVVEKGVLVGRLKWPYAGHVSGVLSCLGLDTDLSGLALIENSRATETLAYLRDEIASSAAALLDHGDMPPSIRDSLETLRGSPASSR